MTGTYPTLDYDIVAIAGQNNTVGQPVYLLPLNPANQLCVTATTGGGTLTIPEAPGFSLTFSPSQVTFPGGSKTGCVSVTSVHPDKVPMLPGFGQQPRFIVTIQPSGALFNPPAPITLPNVDGLKPREVTEMYSFDHDIGQFVAIGTGAVSDDGQAIRSNQGVGVLKAGWHCGGNPNAIGTVADCPVCAFCAGAAGPPGSGITASCVPDLSQVGNTCGPPVNSCVGPSVCGSTSISGSQVPTGQCVTGMNLPAGTTCTVGGNNLCAKNVCRGDGTCDAALKPPTGDGNITVANQIHGASAYGANFSIDIVPSMCLYAGTLIREIVTVASDTCNTGFGGVTLSVTLPGDFYGDHIVTPITSVPCSISTPQTIQWFDADTGQWVTFSSHSIVVTATSTSVQTCYKGVCDTVPYP